MRPFALLPTLAAGLLLAGAAYAAPAAQPTQAQAAAADANVDDLPPVAEDQKQADAMTAQLAAIDDRISSDEARMTTLRDADLTKQNAHIRAIRPALPFPKAPSLSS